MNDDLEKYIDFIFGGLGEGYVYAPVKRPDRWESKFFRYPEQVKDLQDWITSSNLDDGAHVYISPGLYSREAATKDALKELQVCWIEFDGQEQISFGDIPTPTAIVQSSSSTHLHAYWRVERSSPEVIGDVNKRLTYHLGADLSGHDPTQLLRPPGTINRKHDLPVVLAHYSDVQYEFRDFDSAPTVSSPTVGVVEPGQLLKATYVLRERALSNRLIKLVKVETAPVGSRSSFMTRLAYELAEEGLNHVEIVSLLYHADERIGKFRDRTDRLERLTQLAELALHKVQLEDQLPVYTFADLVNLKQELEWILPYNWLHRTGQMILSSAPGVGKTQLVLQLATCLTTEQPFLGPRVGISIEHSIFFMSLEMDKIPLAFFLKQQKVNWKSSPTRVHVVDEPSTLTQYENEIERRNTTVVIIDSLTELLDGLADNPNDSARLAMKWCKKIRRRYNCAIILIHHNRKASEGNKKPKTIHDLAGSFQFAQSSDTVAQLWSDHKGLELSTVKCRFGPDTSFLIERSPSLWFTKVSGPDGDVQGNNSVRQDSSDTPVSREVRGVEVNADRGSQSVGSSSEDDLRF